MLRLPTPVSPMYSFKQSEQATAKVTLKLLQDIEVFNLKALLTFLNVNSFDNNNESQHSHRHSWYYSIIASSLLNSTLVSSLLKLDGCRLLCISSVFSSPGALFLVRTSTEVLIVLYMGRLFGLTIEISDKTRSACFSFGFLSSFYGISRAFLITFLVILTG